MIDFGLDLSLESVFEVVIFHSMTVCFQKLDNFAKINMLRHF